MTVTRCRFHGSPRETCAPCAELREIAARIHVISERAYWDAHWRSIHEGIPIVRPIVSSSDGEPTLRIDKARKS
jgi:hypothetical protein